MDPRRWEQIRAVFDEVVEVNDAERARQLDVISTTDPALRAAVDKLLRADADADAWLKSVESPLGVEPERGGLRAQRTLEIQARLQSALGGAYRVERELGGGGMSYVFVAEETAFKRFVVIKVLRPDLAEAISAKRFQREIQLAARLQHPHIVPLLSAGEVDGLLYYTMPFVDGESLRDRLRREGELPIDDTVRFIRDVTSALAYAHRHGVVHRDIKPENVLLSDGGAVVADFGIAKALSASRTHGDDTVMVSNITERGMALGTPLYMAPEQAADNPAADHRADLYALGAMVYEMLAGRPPFEGRSSQQLMAAHAVETPHPVANRRPNTPPGLATLVMRCLEKQPADRPQSAQEILAALDHAVAMGAAAPLSSSGVDARTMVLLRRPIHLMAWALTATLVGVGAGLAIAPLRRAERLAQPSWFDLALPDSAMPHEIGEVGSIALSPDGSEVAYIGTPAQSLFVRPLHERLPQRIEGTEGAACPVFSPDGRWIAFISNLRLKKIPVRGGSPVTLADSAAGCPVAWTDRNDLLFIWRGPLFRVSADGGPVSLVTRGDSSLGVSNILPSHALPGGKAALVCIGTGIAGTQQLGVVSLPSGSLKRLTDATPPGLSSVPLQHCPAQYASGYVLFARNRTLFARPFSLRTLGFTGPEVPLLRDSLVSFSTTANKTLAYISAAAPRSFNLVAVGEGGKTRTLGGRDEEAGLTGSRLLSVGRRVATTPLDTAYYSWPRLSPDGKRVVMELYGNSKEVLWVYDIASHTLSRLNTRSRGGQPTAWTADGRKVVYIQIDSGNIGGPRRVVSQPWDGSAPARDLIRFPERFSGSIHTMFDISIGPSHGYAAFVVANFSDTADVWIAPLDTPSAARPFVATGAREFQPRLSPDGKLLAYTTNETGPFEVKIRSVLGPATLLQVSSGGGFQPLWSRDGRQLFYRAPGFMSAPGFLMRATIARGEELSVARRDTLFRDIFDVFDVVNYDVFPDGKELLMVRPNRPGAHATVALNWPELLLQRPPPRQR
jgi:Tol biopolymer transport system component/tRNA A-37 threonylcarbamoyl transferase component Bud32